jgi:hypothetical protein
MLLQYTQHYRPQDGKGALARPRFKKITDSVLVYILSCSTNLFLHTQHHGLQVVTDDIRRFSYPTSVGVSAAVEGDHR